MENIRDEASVWKDCVGAFGDNERLLVGTTSWERSLEAHGEAIRVLGSTIGSSWMVDCMVLEDS